MIYRNQKKENEGFVLLLTVIVASVVLAIGLSILELTVKELQLSTLSRDSEAAFHAANAGLECARYWRNQYDDNNNDWPDAEEGLPVTINCFGGGNTTDTPTDITVDDPNNGGVDVAEAYQYTFVQDWEAGTNRCSVIDMVVIVPGLGVDEVTGLLRDDQAIVSVDDLPARYPSEVDVVCPSGGRCTIAFVQGFNTTCANRSNSGTIQREVLLRF